MTDPDNKRLLDVEIKVEELQRQVNDLRDAVNLLAARLTEALKAKGEQ